MQKKLALLIPTLTMLLAACSSPTPVLLIPSPAPTLTSPPSLATPYANMPAAGICGSFEGYRVTISIEPGIANPRCVQVTASQIFTVVNVTEGPIDVSLGTFQATLAPGQSIDIDKPFGDYLAKGVHLLGVSPCCGAELVLGIDLNS